MAVGVGAPDPSSRTHTPSNRPGDTTHTGLMDDALPWLAALPVAVLLGIVLVVMILAARVGGWLRERWWTKRRP
jgi:hypothetical protein